MQTSLSQVALLGLFVSLTAACSSSTAPPPDTQPTKEPTVEEAGKFVVGNATITIEDKARNRTLRAEIWYPATEEARAKAEAGAPIEDFAAPGKEHDDIAALVAKAPNPGTNRMSHSARDATPATGPFPVVAFSHCFDGTRYATFSIAERLASHGIAVIAPDHTGGALPDALAGTAAALDTAFLAIRAGDIEVALDRVLDASSTEIPANLRGHFDASRVGVFGHSFGGVTTGLVLMQDKRPKAGLALAVPMENPLLPGVTVKSLHVPLFFLEAMEDHSIGEIGNTLIDQNFTDANPPVTLAKVADAGHWSFTDICGIIPDFDPGCGKNPTRQGDGTPFNYVDIEVARGIAKAYVTAFFLSSLEDDMTARAYLDGAHPAMVVTTKSKKP